MSSRRHQTIWKNRKRTVEDNMLASTSNVNKADYKAIDKQAHATLFLCTSIGTGATAVRVVNFTRPVSSSTATTAPATYFRGSKSAGAFGPRSVLSCPLTRIHMQIEDSSLSLSSFATPRSSSSKKWFAEIPRTVEACKKQSR